MRLGEHDSHARVRDHAASFDDAVTLGDQTIQAALVLERNEMSAE
jgi:hypothetical protein